MNNIAIVYIAHDGFTSLYTGVGTVARDFLLSFPDVCNNLKKEHKNVQLDLFATTIKYDKDCFGYSEDVKKITESYEKKYRNIHLVELLNGSGGKKSYGTIDLWKNASISASTFIYSLLKLCRYKKVIAVCVDTPFAQVANHFFDQYSFENVNFIWLPQSTVLIHKIDSALSNSFQQKKYIQERYSWEKAVIDLAKDNYQIKIGYVGNFMKQHLIKSYKARKNTLVSLQNGLYFNRLKSNIINQNKISSILNSIGVPLDRSLLFSFGRAESYKGLDLVVKNCGYLIEKMNYFVLILASPYSMKDSYVSKLKKLADKYPQDMKIIFDLDFLTPHYIMQWKNLKILALLSRAEPFGLTPIESRFYKNVGLSLVVSNKDGFDEQVTDGIDGYKTRLDDKAIRLKFREVAELDNKKRSTMAERGYNRIMQNYNQIKINSDFIKHHI